MADAAQARTVKILSVDGGGIRGIIPAVILEHIEAATGQPTAKLFDLIAGTSTGGILALGLACPGSGNPRYTAGDLREFYENQGETIFSRSVWHRLRAVGNALEEKYPADNLERLLKEYFGNARLKEAVTNVLLTAYEIERRDPFFFRSATAKRDPAADFPMWEAARATSAAPTYFEPARVPGADPRDYYALIDGGVFANNPAMCAYAEAKTLFPEEANDFLIVSLGTGQLTRRLPYDEAKDWGLLKWAQPLLSVVFDGVSDAVDCQLRQLVPPGNGRRRYYRFQIQLYQGNDDMDDAGRENVRILKLLAEEIIRDGAADLEALCAELRSGLGPLPSANVTP